MPKKKKEIKDEELVTRLKNTREDLYVLEHKILADEKRLKVKIKLVTHAKANIDSLLFDLTGDAFYKSAGKGAK